MDLNSNHIVENKHKKDEIVVMTSNKRSNSPDSQRRRVQSLRARLKAVIKDLLEEEEDGGGEQEDYNSSGRKIYQYFTVATILILRNF